MNELISMTEAAARLGISHVTLRKILAKNNITTYADKIDSRRRLVSAKDIDKLEVEYEPAPEELAGVIEAITQSEAEKLAGVHITKDDIVQLAARILAGTKSTKQRATA